MPDMQSSDGMLVMLRRRNLTSVRRIPRRFQWVKPNSWLVGHPGPLRVGTSHLVGSTQLGHLDGGATSPSGVSCVLKPSHACTYIQAVLFTMIDYAVFCCIAPCCTRESPSNFDFEARPKAEVAAFGGGEPAQNQSETL